jgi:hypothetical protein
MAFALLAVVGGQVVYPLYNELHQAETAQAISSSTQALGRMNFETQEIVRAVWGELERDPAKVPDARREFDVAKERGMRAAGRVDALRTAYEDYKVSGRPEGGDPLVEALADRVVEAYTAQAERIAAVGKSDVAAAAEASRKLAGIAERAGRDSAALGDWIVERMPR